MINELYQLEIVAFNLESCNIAQAAGADRVELCDNPGEGGTTPSLGFIKAVRKKLSIQLYPIIRPRGGDFLYSDDEFEVMMNDIKLCKDAGCDGIVTGILNPDGTIDRYRCERLAEIAYPLGAGFHRAFDRTPDPFAALETIIQCGYERILSSGQRPAAAEGAELIASLIKQADERIIIMPGSGVRSGNILSIAEKTGATEFHASARILLESKMEYINKEMKEQLQTVTADKKEIEKIIDALKSLPSEIFLSESKG